MNTAINIYKRQVAHSTDVMGLPELVASLLDKASSHIQVAKQSIESKNYEQRVRSSNQASDILLGLSNTLEFDTPEKASVSTTLKTYYEAINDLIHNMNIRNDIELCKSIEKSLRDMANHWRNIDRILKEQKSVSAPSEPTGPCTVEA